MEESKEPEKSSSSDEEVMEQTPIDIEKYTEEEDKEMDKIISKNIAKKNDVWKNLEKTLGQPADDKFSPVEKKYSNEYSWRTNSGPLDFEPLAPK